MAAVKKPVKKPANKSVNKKAAPAKKSKPAAKKPAAPANKPAAPSSAARAAYEKLRSLAGVPEWQVPDKTGRPLAAWIADFLNTMDESWLPVLLDEHKRTCKLPDDHPKIVPGITTALCRLLGNVDAIVKAFPKSNRSDLGFVRAMELWRGIARLGTPEAIAYILADVDAWIDAVNRREYGTLAFRALLELDRPETHARIARLLEVTESRVQQWSDVMYAVEVAGKYKAKVCLPGLRRIQGMVGSRSGHQRVAAAIAAVEAA